MAPSTTPTVPSAGSLRWAAGHPPDFWSIVPHVDTVYARTSAGIMWWNDPERQWRSVRTNPHDRFCMGLAAGSGSRAPLYATERQSLFVSYDGGRHWTRQQVPFTFFESQMAIAGSPRDPLTVYGFGPLVMATNPELRAQYALVWSFDAGRTWDGPVLAGPVGKPFQRIRHSLIVRDDPPPHVNGGTFMATPHGVYRWGSPPAAGAGAEPVLELPVTDTKAVDTMAVGPGAKSRIAVAGVKDGKNYLRVSPDGGSTWAERNPYPHKFIIDDLLYVDDLLFVKLIHWDPAQNGKESGAILMSRDDGASWIDIATPDLAQGLTRQFPSDWPREGLASSATQLYVMSATIGAHAIDLAALRALKA